METVVRSRNRLLLGLFVGALIFGTVFAAAASLGLTVETLSADQAAIASCDADGVASDYTTVYSATAGGGAGGYVVDLVTMSYSPLTAVGLEPAACRTEAIVPASGCLERGRFSKRCVKRRLLTRKEAHELEDVLGTLRRFYDTYPG